MSNAKGDGEQMSIRDQKRQQLKKTAKKHEMKETRTKAIYEECMLEIKNKKAKESQMHKCIEHHDDQEAAKPQRNIFKMSRVLVNKKEKKLVSKSKQAQEELKLLMK